uniref:GTPase activating protein (SH3 domain) binding protein 1 n=1 Tax=Salmo trutta TaxID=8032 RepID=A0A673W1F8_SALTR
MVMEKPSAQLVGREFVRQYYTLLNQAPDYLHRFYGKNSSYVHGGLDNNGKPVESVYGQSEIHKKVLALNFRDCHTKIRHVDAHATLNEGVVVQVMGELSNDMQPMRKFMQTFVLAPEGTVTNKFYVHNDVFRYQDEVFGDSDSEPPEESDEDVEEMEERVPSPEVVQEEVDRLIGMLPDLIQLDLITSVSSLLQPFSWASVTSKNLPPSGVVPVSGIPPHVVKVPSAPPRVEVKTEAAAQRTQPRGDQRPREARPGPPPVNRGPRPGVREGEQGESSEVGRVVRYPDAHQLFVGNVPHDVDKAELKDFFQQYGTVLELRINSGGKLPNFGFVVFDDSEPVQKILSNRPIKFRGDVRLNVEEKKTRSAREGDRRDIRPRGPGGPGGPRERIGGPRGPPTRGGMAQKPSFGSGRGTGPNEGGRYMGPRQ